MNCPKCAHELNCLLKVDAATGDIYCCPTCLAELTRNEQEAKSLLEGRIINEMSVKLAEAAFDRSRLIWERGKLNLIYPKGVWR